MCRASAAIWLRRSAPRRPGGVLPATQLASAAALVPSLAEREAVWEGAQRRGMLPSTSKTHRGYATPCPYRGIPRRRRDTTEQASQLRTARRPRCGVQSLWPTPARPIKAGGCRAAGRYNPCYLEKDIGKLYRARAPRFSFSCQSLGSLPRHWSERASSIVIVQGLGPPWCRGACLYCPVAIRRGQVHSARHAPWWAICTKGQMTSVPARHLNRHAGRGPLSAVICPAKTTCRTNAKKRWELVAAVLSVSSACRVQLIPSRLGN